MYVYMWEFAGEAPDIARLVWLSGLRVVIIHAAIMKLNSFVELNLFEIRIHAASLGNSASHGSLFFHADRPV